MATARLVLSLALFVAAIPLVRAEPPRPIAKDHPILGRWTITIPEVSCSETYTFRPDGTSVVTSGEEIAESVLEISAKPSPLGFYKWTDRLVKDNGKKDCAGEITEVGQVVTNFVQFHPSGVAFILCAGESLDRCIGPFMRAGGDAI